MIQNNKEEFLNLIEEHKLIIYKICNSYCKKAGDRDDPAVVSQRTRRGCRTVNMRNDSACVRSIGGADVAWWQHQSHACLPYHCYHRRQRFQPELSGEPGEFGLRGRHLRISGGMSHLLPEIRRCRADDFPTLRRYNSLAPQLHGLPVCRRASHPL